MQEHDLSVQENWEECFQFLENDHGKEARELAEQIHQSEPELVRQQVAWRVLCELTRRIDTDLSDFQTLGAA